MKRILVVDDEQDVCNLIKMSLEETGRYSVMTCSIPEAVMRLVKTERPDMILLDIVMPNMKGTEVIKALKGNAATASTLIVVTSGLGEMVYRKSKNEWKWLPNRPVVQHRGEVIKEKSAEKAAQAYGVDDFLAKPFSPATLLSVVDDLFNPTESESVNNNE